MSTYESRAADWTTELIAEDQAERDDDTHDTCTGDSCDIEHDPAECPAYRDDAQAWEERQDDE